MLAVSAPSHEIIQALVALHADIDKQDKVKIFIFILCIELCILVVF
jgi:hypothetical protein